MDNGGSTQLQWVFVSRTAWFSLGFYWLGPIRLLGSSTKLIQEQIHIKVCGMCMSKVKFQEAGDFSCCWTTHQLMGFHRCDSFSLTFKQGIKGDLGPLTQMKSCCQFPEAWVMLLLCHLLFVNYEQVNKDWRKVAANAFGGVFRAHLEEYPSLYKHLRRKQQYNIVLLKIKTSYCFQ